MAAMQEDPSTDMTEGPPAKKLRTDTSNSDTDNKTTTDEDNYFQSDVDDALGKDTVHVNMEPDDDDDTVLHGSDGNINSMDETLSQDEDVNVDLATDDAPAPVISNEQEFEVIDDLENAEGDAGSDDDILSEDDLDDDEIYSWLDEGLNDSKKNPVVDQEDDDDAPITQKEKIILKERGTDVFEFLPEGWICVTHNSGMPVYLHKQSRVCTMCKPYFLGTGSIRKHDIPLSAIPCLQYRRELQKEQRACQAANTIPNGGTNAETQGESHEICPEKTSQNITDNQTDWTSSNTDSRCLVTQSNTPGDSLSIQNDQLTVNVKSLSSNRCDTGDGLNKQSCVDSSQDNRLVDKLNRASAVTNDAVVSPVLPNSDIVNMDPSDNVTEGTTCTPVTSLLPNADIINVDSSDNATEGTKPVTSLLPNDCIVNTESMNSDSTIIVQCTNGNTCSNIGSRSGVGSTTNDAVVTPVLQNRDIVNMDSGVNAMESATAVTSLLPNGDIVNTKSMNNDITTEAGTAKITQSAGDVSIGSRRAVSSTMSSTAVTSSLPNGGVVSNVTNQEASSVGAPQKLAIVPIVVQNAQEKEKESSVDFMAVRNYCMQLFEFRTIQVKRFKTWRKRREHHANMKRQNRPSLPANTKIITLGQTDKGTDMKRARKFILNPNGKSNICILHEYVQHVMKIQPKYIFRDCDESTTPYSATVVIGEVEYGTGFAASKRTAKAAAAKATLTILLPEMSSITSEEDKNMDMDDFSFFDEIRVEDPRVQELCNKAGQQSPFQILLECLKRNYGMGDTQVQMDMQVSKPKKNLFTMTVGKHTATIQCNNKREGKQLAAQAILQLLHPHIKTWGSLLRLYGRNSFFQHKEKSSEKDTVTQLQSLASSKPNSAILDRLRVEMIRVKNQKRRFQSIGRISVNKSELPLPTVSINL